MQLLHYPSAPLLHYAAAATIESQHKNRFKKSNYPNF